jgi:predicted small secreted protein
MARRHIVRVHSLLRPTAFLLASLLLISCNTTSDVFTDIDPNIATSPINTNTDHFSFGDYSSSAWVSESFKGRHNRQFKSQALDFDIVQETSDGGFDVGLSRINRPSVKVAEAKKNLRMCSSYETDLSGEGRWWAGPKISVNWQGDEAARQNGDDWYENYIVEMASSTPNELHNIFMGDYFKAEELPTTKLVGSAYRHYKIRFHSWWQFWSVRQNYRSSGSLPLEPIIDVWIEHGLPTHRIFDGVKANIETYGDMAGSGRLRMDVTNDPTKPLACN